MPIIADIDVMLAKRKMPVGTLAERVGITPANLAVLKNGRAKAVRFTTLAALCKVLNCQPGDLLRWEPGNPEDETPPAVNNTEPLARGRHSSTELVPDPADPSPTLAGRVPTAPVAVMTTDPTTRRAALPSDSRDVPTVRPSRNA